MADDRTVAKWTAYAEASNQRPLVRRAVIRTGFNRLALSPQRYGTTLAAVFLTRYQYSSWNSDQQSRQNLLRAAHCSDSDPVMLDCAAAYDEVEGGAPDPTLGATHYYDTSIDAPGWTAGATMTVQIDALVFYRDVK